MQTETTSEKSTVKRPRGSFFVAPSEVVECRNQKELFEHLKTIPDKEVVIIQGSRKVVNVTEKPVYELA